MAAARGRGEGEGEKEKGEEEEEEGEEEGVERTGDRRESLTWPPLLLSLERGGADGA